MKLTSKGVAVIGIDHGYGNIKTANTVTPTGIIAYDSKPTFDGNILCYEGKYYRIGEGHKAFIADKVQDSDFYILTLMGIARELYREKLTTADVHLAVGLPLTWVKSQRDSFRQYLTEKENVTFTFRDIEYSVHIVGCTVYPQGYTAVIDRLGEMGGVNMLADIGNGTMNVMYINNKKPVESKCWTEKLGVEQCVIRVKNAVRDNFGTTIEDTHIEQIIRTGTADISPKYLDLIKAVMTDYCKEIFEALNEYDERHSRLTDDPFFESREREDKFVEQIVTAVESALDKALPTFFSATFFKMIQPYGTAAPPVVATVDESPKKSEKISADDVDWDFLGG